MWLIIVEETAERTPEQARVLLDPTVRKWMEKNGHHFRTCDKDQSAEDLQEWIHRALQAADLPRLFAVSESGEVVFEGPLPHSPLEMLALVKKYGREK